MTDFRRQAAVGLAVAMALMFGGMAGAQDGPPGLTLLKMGWTYTIGFPEGSGGDLANPSGLTPGVHTYRVRAFGGEQWYRLQRVARHPNGGWYSPRGTPDVWVNLNYAFWIHEVTR